MFQIYFLSSINGFWLGTEKLGDKIDTQVAIFANTMSQHTLFNIKTDRQTTYNLTKGDIHSRHTYTPYASNLSWSFSGDTLIEIMLYLVCFLLRITEYSITPSTMFEVGNKHCKCSYQEHSIKQRCLYSTRYWPKNVIPMFHLDNIDWLEDKPDGKNTTHYLILSIFQRKQNCSGNYLPELDQHTTSLKLLENSFGVLLPHDKPVKGMSKRTEGASDFKRQEC